MPDRPPYSGENMAGLNRLEALVAARMGLYFPDQRKKDIRRGADALAKEHGQDNTNSFLESLLVAELTDRQIEVLTAHLTVGETYFFREMKSLDAFRCHILPELIRQRAHGDRKIRIWSAGCSTGEEAYTLAMLISELIPDPGKWNIKILATDINPKSLNKARRGIYTKWSFRSVPEEWRDRYFERKDNGTFEVSAKFKKMVTFAHLNLAADIYPAAQNDTGEMDVIFCRNVLMYFVPELAQQVLCHFQRCLTDDGWLVTAPSETPMLLSSRLAAVHFDGAILYRKDRNKTTSTVWSPLPPTATNPSAEIKTAFRPLPQIIKPAPPVACIKPSQPVDSKPPAEQPYIKALAAYQSGCYADAKALLEDICSTTGSASRDDGGHGEAFALMARIEADQGKLEQAAAWAQKAIGEDKVNPGFYYLLATIFEEQHQPKEAAQALKRALYLDPVFILAHYALGHIALREKRRKEAFRHFKNVQSLLAPVAKDLVLPESDGTIAGRLLEVVESLLKEENFA